MSVTDGVVNHLARCAVELRRQPLTAEVEAAARSALIDWLAATVGGSAEPAGGEKHHPDELR